MKRASHRVCSLQVCKQQEDDQNIKTRNERQFIALNYREGPKNQKAQFVEFG